MTRLIFSVALALLLGLFTVSAFALTHSPGIQQDPARLQANPVRLQTVAQVYRVEPVRHYYYQPVPGYYYGPPYYYDYYYNQPGFSIGLPFFYFHAR